MPTQTSDPVQSTSAPIPPVLPTSGEALYNELMAKIEPELLTDQIPLLKEKYKNETPEQKKARGEKYEKAYATYDKAYEQYMSALSGNVTQYKHAALSSAEASDRAKEVEGMQALESAISLAA